MIRTYRNDQPGLRQWVLQGPGGAVTWTLPDAPGSVPPISLHRPGGTRTCHLLGTCIPDVTWTHGAEFHETWKASGQGDAIVYIELLKWYESRLAE